QSLTASYFTYFALVPIAVVALVEIWRTCMPLATLAKNLVPAALMAAVVIVPIARAYYEVRAQSGLKRSFEEIRMQSADVAGYFSPPPNVRLWSGRSSIRGEREVFPGVAAIVLAVAAIGATANRRTAGLYAAVLCVAFVLSLGPEPMA